MPRISPLAKASATLAACAEAVSDANGLNSSTLSNLSNRMKSYSGFGEGVCTCARCMRRAGPIREDVENKLVQITYALANVYDDSPDLEVRVADAHRQRSEEMMQCVESGDVTRLREMFLEIEEQESDGVLEGGTATEIATYLIISAAQVGQPEVIRLLAEWDADMEETDSIRRGRPLMHAANNGHTAAVKALVDCGADPEATDDNGYTALMVAVFSDRSSAAEALVDGGACVDAQDRAGRTALSYAAMYGSTDCIYLLAARGADVAHVDHDGNTPLELAEGSGRQSAVDALKKLQLRVKMQEKRKVKQSKCRSGCSDLDAAQLQAKEQEAARAAAELLEQLEKEEAARTAKAAKKKKKGKSKAAAADCATSDTAEAPQQELATDHMPVANGVHGTHGQHQQQRRLQQQHSSSEHSSATWPAQDLRAEHDDSASSKAADGKHPRKQAKQAASTSPGGSSSGKQPAASHAGSQHDPSAQQQLQQQQQHSVAHADDTASSADSDAELDVLRREWEVLLEQAARCKEQRQQPMMLARVADMLPRCSDAGISVKYGRKVLQRLQAVGPARAALQAALANQHCSIDELEAALGASKSCRCLLEDDLLQLAEDVLANLLKEQEQHQEQLRRQQEAEQQARLQQQQLAAQQAQQQQQRAAQQAAQQQQQAQWPANTVARSEAHDMDRLQETVQQQQQQQLRSTAGLVQQQQQQQPPQPKQQHVSQQEVQHMHQQVQQVVQQMAQQLPQLVPLQQPAPQQQQQPPVQAPSQRPVQPAQQQTPQQQLPQLQPVQPPQQQQHVGMQHQLPDATMPSLQQPQQLRGLQPQMQQQQQHPLQVQQQHRGLLPQQPPLGTSVSSALPVPSLLASQQQQQQQHSLSQLQLLQQQQQLFASQQPHPLSQLQRGPVGPGMLVGTPPMNPLSRPGGMGLLTPMSQAAARLQQAQQMQQQQQLGGSYWGGRASFGVAPGGFGSVGQPMARSPVAGGRLSLDLLTPQPGIPCTSGLSAAAGELARRSSLSTPVAVVAPVLLSGQTDADVLDDHQHPAYAMANALLSDDEDRDSMSTSLDPVVNPVVECKMCLKGRVDTCCLPCGCLLMCQGCALLWKQRGELSCPWCKALLEDFAVL